MRRLLYGGVPKGSGNCPHCGTWRLRLHRDHIIPRWKGGTNTSENIQYLCANCHEDKTREDMIGKPISSESKKKLSQATLEQWKRPSSKELLARLQSPEERERRRVFALEFWKERKSKGLTGTIQGIESRLERRAR